MSEADFEKLGVFYLGRIYDMAQKQVESSLCLLESPDMTTSALCLGMKGSGKTGLCVGIIEEAAIDGIPVIAVDVKGDVSNVLLQFPQLSPKDLQPWIDFERVRKSGLTPEEYAVQQADDWKKGLTAFDQNPDRIQKLKDSADFAVYSPGSSAGLPVSVAGAFLVPPESVLNDGDNLRARIAAIASGLLALAEMGGDRQNSREHLLLSTIIKNAWQHGQHLTPPVLIKQIQQPPFQQVGALDCESFFPEKERLPFAQTLNGVLASMSFEALVTGAPLAIDKILYSPNGRPRVSIFSVAHLPTPERMFFITHLLNEIIAWMRLQERTYSLRALVHLDEVSEYVSPQQSLSVKPLLQALLKEGREHGVGLLLSSDSPARIDYNALSDVGTWFIGGLQLPADRGVVLDGLETVIANSGLRLKREALDSTIAALSPRVMLMLGLQQSILPVTFVTRATLSYLRGPMPPTQIKSLMQMMQNATPQVSPVVPPAVPAFQPNMTPRLVDPAVAAHAPSWWQSALEHSHQSASAPLVQPVRSQAPGPPPLEIQSVESPPPIPVEYAPVGHFLPIRQERPSGSRLVYAPRVFAVGNAHFVDSTAPVDTTLQYCVLASIDGANQVDWDKAQPAKVWMEDLLPEPEHNATFDPLPSVFESADNVSEWTDDFIVWLCKAKKLRVLKSELTCEVSKPRETERDFRIRLAQTSREQRDQAAEAVKLRYMPLLAMLNERLMQAKKVFEREERQERDHKVDSTASLAKNVLGDYFGRKAANWAKNRNLDLSNVAHRTGASKPMERSAADEAEIQEATETVEALSEKIDDANLALGAALADLERKFDPLQLPLTEVVVDLEKDNVAVPLLGLAWAPYFAAADGSRIPAWVRAAVRPAP